MHQICIIWFVRILFVFHVSPTGTYRPTGGHPILDGDCFPSYYKNRIYLRPRQWRMIQRSLARHSTPRPLNRDFWIIQGFAQQRTSTFFFGRWHWPNLLRLYGVWKIWKWFWRSIPRPQTLPSSSSPRPVRWRELCFITVTYSVLHPCIVHSSGLHTAIACMVLIRYCRWRMKPRPNHSVFF